MNKTKIYRILTLSIASLWFANGFLCKVLNLVPRHELIVSRILGESYSQPITVLIGIFEILMAIWILSNLKPKLNTIIQITIIVIMNALEFIMAKDLLLWGKFNAVFALLLIIIIYYTNFKFHKHDAITN